MDKLKSVEKEICEYVCLVVSTYSITTLLIIVEQYKVTVKIIVVDFSGGPEIYDKIRIELSGLNVGILVNNVGVTHGPDYFLTVSDNKFWQMINVNMASVVMVGVTVCV